MKNERNQKNRQVICNQEEECRKVAQIKRELRMKVKENPTDEEKLRYMVYTTENNSNKMSSSKK